VNSVPQIFELNPGFFVAESMRIPCTKSSKLSTKVPRMIVLHWTAAPLQKTEEGNLARIKRWAANAADKSSTHFVIMRSGALYQMVSTERASWNAGKSSWVCADGTASSTSVNLFSIGIDFDNVGPLTLSKGKLYDCYGGEFGGVAQEVPRWNGYSFFEQITREQLWTCRVLCDALRARYNIALSDIVGHLTVSPGRKIDPGPLVTHATLGWE